ncbi:MAG: MerR family transcriptional regulator [Methylovirgula sp.]
METNPRQTPTERDGREDAHYKIGDIAREFGISLRALRFYEDRGLLHPQRRGTTRLYSRRDRSHLQVILKGKQLGFTLTEIRDRLIARSEAMDGQILEFNLHPDHIVAQIRHLERQRANLDLALAELRQAHQRAQGDRQMNRA